MRLFPDLFLLHSKASVGDGFLFFIILAAALVVLEMPEFFATRCTVVGICLVFYE